MRRNSLRQVQLAIFLLPGFLPFFAQAQDGWTACLNLNREMLPEAVAIFAQQPPDIDGYSSEDVWAKATDIAVSKSVGNLSATAYDFSASFKVLWNQEYLYFFVTVVDDTMVTYDQRSDCKTWQNDCVELFFNPDGHTPGDCPGKSGLDEGSEIHANPGDDQKIRNKLAGKGYHNSVKDKAGYKYKSKTTDQGYTMEIQVPWSLIIPDSIIVLNSTDIMQLGFDLNICDADDPGAACPELREHIYTWASPYTDNFKNTSYYGILKLEKP